MRTPLPRLAPLLVLVALSLVRTHASADSYVMVQRVENPVPHGAGNLFANFGTAVAELGTTGVVVGAPNQDTVTNEAGAGYLFDVATGALLQTFVPPVSAGSAGL